MARYLLAGLALWIALGASAQMPPSPTRLSSAMPPDAPALPAFGFSAAEQADFQRKLDIFAWKEFVALNWPAAGTGIPSQKQIGDNVNGDNGTVWETYLSPSQVFRPGARPPAAWGTREPIPGFCPTVPVALAREPLKLLSLVAKGDVQGEFIESFSPSPLFDVNGRYTRYEVRINRDEYEQILQGTKPKPAPAAPWYIPANQIAPMVLPAGDLATGQIGAVEVKASWRQINPAQRPRFHSTYAYITYAPDPKTRVNTKCAGPFLMGMVGLHIAHKTASFPQWVWATFEHVDNDPPPASSSAANYSYNNDSQCLIPGCANQPPSPHVAYDGDPHKTYPPVQVVRATPIPPAKNDPTTGINPWFQTLLKNVNSKSVWQYYQLVDTQWPSQPGTLVNPILCYHDSVHPMNPWNFKCDGPNGDEGPIPLPNSLVNTTMETYFQADSKNAFMGSCMGCHSNATAATGAPNPTAFTDFSFLIGDAQPPSMALKAPRVLRKAPR